MKEQEKTMQIRVFKRGGQRSTLLVGCRKKKKIYHGYVFSPCIGKRWKKDGMLFMLGKMWKKRVLWDRSFYKEKSKYNGGETRIKVKKAGCRCRGSWLHRPSTGRQHIAAVWPRMEAGHWRWGKAGHRRRGSQWCRPAAGWRRMAAGCPCWGRPRRRKT